jgi:N-acetyltransferase
MRTRVSALHMKIEPVVLEGEHVRLEPLSLDHLPAIYRAGMDESIWQWTSNSVKTEMDLERFVRTALSDQANGTALPFATIDRSSGMVVGSTRFGNIEVSNRKAEIGWTWINPKWQRTFINTEAKLLMLTHAFEVWNCIRVELKTDSNNERSQNAIRRLGAVEEGTLRNHMITESGRFRHSVVFSIIDSEWDTVRARLISKMASAV